MPAPSDISITNLTGDWVIDKSKTENLDAALKLQGISWLRRKAVTSGTITLKITQTTTPDPSLMMQQGLRSIFPGVEQTRSLDWSEHEHVDAVSGAAIKVKSRFVAGTSTGGKVKPVLTVQTGGAVDVASIEGYLTSEADGSGSGGLDLQRAFVQDFIWCEEGGWSAEQVWAIERDGDDVFLFCRAVAVKGSEVEKACLVYRLEEQQ
ncbi:hypothetical protein BJY04DRAFT_213364 [Aspergillus karnatakaensis]|uniref:uncharacterized protein n=1 Tax=Aspergillus karnatakaensis TaxID=1810916 RepID=UPI003CCDE3E8